MIFLKFSVLPIVYILLIMTSIQAGTLEDVKKRGKVRCGVTTGLEGFSMPDKKGNWQGFDVDICQAVAAAVFGNPNRVTYIETTGKTRFSALNNDEIDMLSRVTTWTLTRDVELGLNFAGVSLYDGQGFMVNKSLKVKKAKDLNGATICMNSGTSTEANVAEFFEANRMRYKAIVFEKSSEAADAYNSGRCNVYTTDKSGLASQRLKMDKPRKHKILEDTISKEPLGPAVKDGDEKWAEIVRWTLYALIEAEELGITQRNVNSVSDKGKPRVSRLLGATGENGKKLGLADDWVVKVILSVGNYAEIYERHLGEKTQLDIPRGLNNLWTRGGLMYAIPFN